MPTTITCIRHAHAFSNIEQNRSDGWAIVRWRLDGYALTQRWYEQARLTGEYLKNIWYTPDIVIISPAIRTRMTADTICTILDIPYSQRVIDPRIQEIGQWVWEGRLKSEVFTREMMTEISEKKWHHKPEGWESSIDVQNRMQSAIFSLVETYTDQKILMISHGYSLKMLTRWLSLGWWDPDILESGYGMSNTGIVELEYSYPTIGINILDDMHIPESLKSR
jgi:broad specificity phosphatase PhoE